MSARRRLPIRSVWAGTLFPLVGLGALASWGMLSPHDDRPAPRLRSVLVASVRGSSRTAPPEEPRSDASHPAPRPRESRSAGVAVASTAGRDEAAIALDRSAEPGLRARALRALSTVDAAATSLACEVILDEPGRDPSLAAEALRQLGTSARLATADRTRAARRIVDALATSDDPEVALACGAALDRVESIPLEAVDLARALARAELPEARVVLLRQLARSSDERELRSALEETLERDPSSQVRAEAVELAVTAGVAIPWLAHARALASDALVRRTAARVLPRVAGHDVTLVLAGLLAEEADATEQARLARALARRQAPAEATLTRRAH